MTETTDHPLDYMTHPERARLRLAAYRVLRLYPGPVGELVRRELLSWDEFGWRFAGHSLVTATVDHILERAEEAA